ncbi:MAG TPA: hypothetical protein VN540_06435 [Clostridia bacterium]|nr:hypothetical protein [Clostridia bacterium]
MPKKKKSDEEYLDMATTASANETTGMMPTLPQTREEYEALQDLAGMSIPRKGKRKY